MSSGIRGWHQAFLAKKKETRAREQVLLDGHQEWVQQLFLHQEQVVEFHVRMQEKELRSLH